MLALSPTLLLLACGGKVTVFEDDGGVDPEDTAGSEVTPGDDVGPDGGPTGCGFGRCEPGVVCSPDGCNTCSCSSGGEWGCTLIGCTDASPPPPLPCPSGAPFDGSYCPSEGAYCTYPNGCGGSIYASCASGAWRTKRDGCTTPMPCPPSVPALYSPCSAPTKCNYVNSCGGTIFAYCDGKSWNIESSPCVTPPCPAKQPPEGAACAGPNKCLYSNGCGGSNTAYCESSMSKWVIYKGECTPPPPPPPMCPAALPPPGASCVTGSSCNWNNGCGGLTYGYCMGATWSMKSEGCVSGCPAAKPTSGASCKSPGTSSCRYIVPGTSSCTSQCFCADDYRWACLTPICSGMGGGEVPPG